MAGRTAFKAWINPLQFLEVDEPWASTLGRPIDDRAVLAFLCTPGFESAAVEVAGRYRQISTGRLFAAPAETRILEKLVWPLRNAKASFALANYLGTISLCGTVAEMVAILLFEIGDIRINDEPLTDKLQRALFGRTFEDLGQERRVSILSVHGTIDDRIKAAFDLIRNKRNRYLHLWSQDHERLPADAIAVFHAAVDIVVYSIGQDIDDGTIRLNPALVRYLEKSGIFEPLDDGPRDGPTTASEAVG